MPIIASQLGAPEPLKNLNDPYVQKAAQFAVSEMSKRSNSINKLVLVEVDGGTMQVSNKSWLHSIKACCDTHSCGIDAVTYDFDVSCALISASCNIIPALPCICKAIGAAAAGAANASTLIFVVVNFNTAYSS